MSVEFRIMAVKERREKYILSMLDSLGMDESIVTYDVEGQKKEAMRNARRTWLKPTSETHVCVLQDDLELCDGFVEIVNICAENFPNAIFSFYNARLKPEDANSETPYAKVVGSGMYGPAILMPKELVELAFWWGDKCYGTDFKHDDTVFGFFAETNKIPVMTTIPCIVQHLGFSDSALGYNNKRKVSRVYDPKPDIEFFKTKKWFKTKRIPNTVIVPNGGYKCGERLKTVAELLGERGNKNDK